MGIFNPLISLLMEQHGVDHLMIGANSSLYYLTIALSAPLAGKLIQAYGIRSVIIIGILFTTVATIAFPNTDNLAHWFVLRSLMGMGVCFYMVAGQTGLNIYANDARRGTIVALHGAAFGVAFMASPVIGTISYAHFPKSTFLFGGTAISLGVFTVLYCLPNHLIPYSCSFSLKILKRISIPLQGAFIYGALEGILVTLLPIVLLHEAMPIDWIGFPLTLFMVASGIGMIPVSYFGDKFGRTIVLFFSCVIGLATLVAMSAIDHPYIVPISSTILGLTLGTLFPVTLAMIGSQLDKSEMHAGSSLFTASFSYGCAAGPIFAALCMSSFGDIYIFLPIVVFLILLVTGMMLGYFNAKR
ncbi:MAG: MFS transporter, partial [Gammaproteobacteria bacterium]